MTKLPFHELRDVSQTNQVLIQAWLDYDPERVRINEEVLNNLRISPEQIQILADNEVNALAGRPLNESIAFMLGLNSINYQYWDIVDGRFVRYQHQGKVGALAAFDGFLSLFDQMKENNIDPQTLNADLLRTHFGAIPDIEQRGLILRESMNPNKVAQALILITERATNGALDVDLAASIAKIMPLSFKDPYLKKIQLALYEITQVFANHGTLVPCQITVAADYQIPKVLEGMRVLTYNQRLTDAIDRHELIAPNSADEKALRSATILACEAISLKHNISIPALDRMLWLARNDYRNKNFHLTKTRMY